MSLPRSNALLLFAAIISLVTDAAFAQSYPSKPIRVVTSGVGSAADFVARSLSQGISERLGQQVVVDNRSSSIIPGQIVSQAAPDGYTLLVHGASFWIGALLQHTSFDPAKDFSPLTLATSAPNIVTVVPSVPANSIKELIALAKAKPGQLNYASSATGSSSHLAAELFKSMAGVNLVRIPYASNARLIADLLSGQVQLTFASASNVMPHIKAGRLKALAVTSAQPSVLAPGLPTVASAGLPGYESVSMFGAFGPANVPSSIVSRLNQEMVWVLNRAEVKERFLAVGVETVGSSPQQLLQTVKSEMARMGKVIKEAGIKAE